MQEAANSAPAVELPSQDSLNDQHPHAPAPPYSQNIPQPTQEQLYQYHLFMHTHRPYSPTPSLSFHPDSDKSTTTSTSAIVETVLAIVGMLIMLIVGVIGYQQMNQELEHNQLPDMSGFIVTLATIPIAIMVLTLLMRLAVMRTRKQELELEGQIILPGSEEDGDGNSILQGPRRSSWGVLRRFWSRSETGEVPLLAIDQDLPPAYEERSTQTVGGR